MTDLIEELAPAIEQLRDHQQQIDADGTFVGVSRQALDEVLAAILPIIAREKAAPVELAGLVEELRGEARGLSTSSIRNGCVDCGLASNLAERAATAIEALSRQFEAGARAGGGSKARRLQVRISGCPMAFQCGSAFGPKGPNTRTSAQSAGAGLTSHRQKAQARADCALRRNTGNRSPHPRKATNDNLTAWQCVRHSDHVASQANLAPPMSLWLQRPRDSCGRGRRTLLDDGL